jgi:hypothetical protein
MQIGYSIKMKMWDPKVLFRSLRNAVSFWFGAGESTTQLELNGVPCTNVKTVKLTIGGVGVAGCDFNFATAANTNEQVIDLGAIVPAFARVLDVKTVTEAVFTGATTLVAETGNTSSGNQYIGSATIYAANAITAAAAGAPLAIAPSASAVHVYVAATPGANWSGVTAGKVAVYVTYIEI